MVACCALRLKHMLCDKMHQVPGRHHMVAQTDNYLEDLREDNKGNDFGTQTDAEMDRYPFSILIPT